jgi:hypothetical protein
MQMSVKLTVQTQNFIMQFASKNYCVLGQQFFSLSFEADK